jgi:hypothetical protein
MCYFQVLSQPNIIIEKSKEACNTDVSKLGNFEVKEDKEGKYMHMHTHTQDICFKKYLSIYQSNYSSCNFYFFVLKCFI